MGVEGAAGGMWQSDRVCAGSMVVWSSLRFRFVSFRFRFVPLVMGGELEQWMSKSHNGRGVKDETREPGFMCGAGGLSGAEEVLSERERFVGHVDQGKGDLVERSRDRRCQIT